MNIHDNEITGKIEPIGIEWPFLIIQINRVYEELLKNQIELDPDAKKALYSNLWDLYT